MAFLVNSRTTNNVFGEDLWGKMIKNEANYGQLFSVDWLYTKNFDDNFKFYTTHDTTGNARNPMVPAWAPKYTNDDAGKTQAKIDWDGPYTNNPYPYDDINYVAHDDAIAEGIAGRTWNVHRKNPSLKPDGFGLFGYTEDIGVKPIWTRPGILAGIRRGPVVMSDDNDDVSIVLGGKGKGKGKGKKYSPHSGKRKGKGKGKGKGR